MRNPDQVTGQGAPRIAELGLSVRSHSRLLRSGIETVERLAAMTDDDLMAIGGLGVKSVADIREKLTAYLRSHSLADQHLPPNRPLADRRGTPVVMLGLSARPYYRLLGAGIGTVEHLIVMSDDDLFAIGELGDEQLAEIRRKLAAHLASHPVLRSPGCCPAAPPGSQASPPDGAPIGLLGLSRRVHNALRAVGVNTIEQVRGLRDSQLLAIPNIDKRSLDHIRTCVRTWAEDQDGGVESPANGPGTSPFSGLSVPLAGETPIEVLGLKTWTLRRLRSNGIHTVQRLARMSPTQILGLWDVGAWSLADIQEKLRRYLSSSPLSSAAATVSLEPKLAERVMERASISPDPPQRRETAGIEELGLSGRPYHCLLRAGITTIQRLASYADDKLLAIRNLGFKSLDEIREKLVAYLDSHGLSEQSVASEPLQSDPKLAAHVPSTNRTPISVLGLSARPYSALVRNGIASVGQLGQMSRQEILALWSVGVGSFAEIEEKLAAYLASHPFPPSGPTEPVQPERLTPIVNPALLAHVAGIPLDDISLERLALPARLLEWLEEEGIKSVGELSRLRRDAFHHDSLTVRHLNRYLTWLVGQDEGAWSHEVEGQGISPLHRMELAKTTLEGLIRDWLCFLEERELQIIWCRYGLDGDRSTLAEVGQQMGITRERVRQLQAKTMRRLRHPIRRNRSSSLAALVRHLVDDAGGLMTSEELDTALQDRMIVGSVDPVGVVRLLADVDKRFTWLRSAKALGLATYPLAKLDLIQSQLTRMLKDHGSLLPASELLARFNADALCQEVCGRMQEGFLAACLRTHARIETDEEGSRSLRKWRRRRVNKIIQVLRELGEPAHYSAIVERVNALLQPGERTSAHNIHVQIQHHEDIFVRVGHGIFGLAEWGLADDGCLANAAYRVLEDAGKPLHTDIITEQVLRTWHVRPTSVTAAMQGDSRFSRIGPAVYGLREQIAGDASVQPQVGFGDLYGEQLARWQAELDREQSGLRFDTHAEVDKIRNAGLGFLKD